MIELTINITEKLRLFLDRYYSLQDKLEDRFYKALNDKMIIQKGQGFCLSFESNFKMEEELKQERDDIAERNAERLGYSTTN